MYVLMRRSAVGLDPLPERYDFMASINNKAIEYMSSGLPLLSTPRKGVLFDLLSGERCGMSYDAADAVGLAALVCRLVSEPGLQTAMAENSRRVFVERFTAEKVCAEMAEHFELIASSKAA
jgi:glycosyltransferase involved in cell wall biosynthesis